MRHSVYLYDARGDNADDSDDEVEPNDDPSTSQQLPPSQASTSVDDRDVSVAERVAKVIVAGQISLDAQVAVFNSMMEPCVVRLFPRATCS